MPLSQILIGISAKLDMDYPRTVNYHKILKAWSDEWLLKFHPNKCYSITIGKKEDKDHTYHISDKGTKYNMAQINDMKDIGVIMDSDLKFEKHINSKIDTANKILGIIRRSFMYLSAEIFIPLYKAMVRSHFDYAMVIWNPHTVKYIESIEGVQRRATKMVPEIKKTYHILKVLST